MSVRSFCLVPCVLLLSALVPAAGSAQAPAQAPSFTLIRVAAGPRGAETGGEFKLEQERATFSRSSDTQVVIQFQWQGTPGLHRLGARWRSPSGGLSISEIEYNAPSRTFGAVWTLPITPSMPLGAWAIEATIDGLPSGSLTFEIVDASAPVPAPPRAATRTPLAAPELFRRLDSVYVSIERLASRSGLIDRNGGFVIGPSSVVTAFSALDAADRLELIARDGARKDVAVVGVWDRPQDWAVIPFEAKDATVLPAAPAGSANIGDRCFSMESGPSGQRVLSECAIVGRTTADATSPGLVVQFSSGRSVAGSPVLNEFGEVIGMVAGPPAASYRGMTVFRVGSDPGARVLPIAAIRSPGAGPGASVADLKARNVFMGAVDGRDNILSGGFARDVQRNPLRPVDQRDQFSPADGRLFVFLTWDPRERLRGTMVYRLFDEQNRQVTESKPGKVDLKPGNGTFTYWEIPLPPMPGSYRVDVVVGELTMWRGLFRVLR
jgi:hypothetical protein